MNVQEIIENLEAETLQLLKDGRQKILKVEVCEEIYIALEMRGYFAMNHRLVCGDWPIQLCQKIDKPYKIISEPKPETIDLFKSDEFAIPMYIPDFKYWDA